MDDLYHEFGHGLDFHYNKAYAYGLSFYSATEEWKQIERLEWRNTIWYCEA